MRLAPSMPLLSKLECRVGLAMAIKVDKEGTVEQAGREGVVAHGIVSMGMEPCKCGQR